MIVQKSNTAVVRNFNDLRTLMLDFKISDKVPDKFIEEYDTLKKAHYDQVAISEKIKVLFPVIVGVLILLLRKQISKVLLPGIPQKGATPDHLALYNQITELSNQILSIGFMLVGITLILYLLWLGYKFMTNGYLVDSENGLLRASFRNRCNDFIHRISKETGYQVERRTKLSFRVSPLSVITGAMMLSSLVTFFKLKPALDNPLIFTALIPILFFVAGSLSIKKEISIVNLPKKI